MRGMTRRLFAVGMPVLLGGCADGVVRHGPYYAPPGGDATGAAAPVAPIGGIYADMVDGGYEVPAVDTSGIDPSFLRHEVAYSGREAPGTIIVDPGSRHLTFVEGGGRAIRYGVGVGREGFGWSGVATVKRKSEWPTWTPPSQMIERQPELEQYAGGMPGGLDNPLGARAMYLYQGDRDTLYRIHGTNEPESIGTRVSSGCIRLVNQDVIDLYDRVHAGSKVVVLAGGGVS